MKRAETCSCSLCNKLYISLPPYSCVRQIYTLQSSRVTCFHKLDIHSALEEDRRVIVIQGDSKGRIQLNSKRRPQHTPDSWLRYSKFSARSMG